jgi:hypothetical protein
MVSEVALSVAQKVPIDKNQDSPGFARINSHADESVQAMNEGFNTCRASTET